MPSVFSDMLQSKKFVVTLPVSFTLSVATKYGLMDKADLLEVLKILLPAYLASQGLADIGKHLPKSTKAEEPSPEAPKPEETKAEEPKAEEPKAEDVKVEETKPEA